MFLIIATVGMSSVSGLLFYQLNVVQSENDELKITNDNLENENTELEDLVENFTNKIKITKFSISGFKPVENFIIFESNVYLKLQNVGINDVTQLTLTLVAFGDEKLAKSLPIDDIHAGQEKEISTKVQWVYGSQGTSSATIKLDDLVLAQEFLLFSEVYQ